VTVGALAIERRPTEAPRMVSVIVPVLNAEPWIGEQLEALAGQTYPGRWEVVIVDNGSSDRSIDIARAWQGRLPLRIVAANGRRSLNHARNAGVETARGDFLAFCDADDVVLPTWLAALVAAAGEADIVGGTSDLEALNPPLYRAWRPDEPDTELPVFDGFLPYAAGGNCGMWTSVARALRWDPEFDFGSSDLEFCWRAQLASYELAFVPDAVIRRRYRRRLRELARQYYRYGRSGPFLYRRFRALGMPRDNRKALWWWRWLVRHRGYLTESRAQRGNWIHVAAYRCGRVAGSLRARTLFL
jgi:glycosyltransferase involved in cell wall biosynthesis